MSDTPTIRAAGSFSAASVGWLLIVALAVSCGIGGYGLIEPDEGRNAEIAREMAATGDYVLPRLNGLPYVDKPVLFFAAAAAAIEVLGPTELAVRLVPLLFGLATAALVGWFAFRLWGGEPAVVAATATVTAPLALGLSRVVIMDSMLSFLVVLALICFYIAVESRSKTQSELLAIGSWLPWTLIAWAAVGLGILTKGPVAIALPLLVAAPFAMRRRASLAVWHPLGPLLMVGIVVPWVWAVSHEIPDYLHYVVTTETWARMTTDELRRSEPIWFFVPVLLAGTFPWSVLVLSNHRSRWRTESAQELHARLYLWLWLLVPLVFFSLLRGKQQQYVLPLVPAIALLAAGRWSRSTRGVSLAAALWGVLGLVAVTVGVLGVPGLDATRVPAGAAMRTAVGWGVVAVVGAVAAWIGGRGRHHLALVGLTLPLVAFPVISAPLLAEVAADRSARGLAAEIEKHLTPGTELIWVESFAAGLSFYLERVVPVASVDGGELRSNYLLQNSRLFFQGKGALRPLESAFRSVVDCSGPLIVLLSAKNTTLDESFREGGAPLLEKTRRWIAYGPACPIVDQNICERLVNPKVSD